MPSPSSRIDRSTASITGSISITRSTSPSRRRVATTRQNTGVQLNVGLLGLGTVGGQVAERLLAKREAIRERTGGALNLRKAVMRDPARPRAVPPCLTTGSVEGLLDGPTIQV